MNTPTVGETSGFRPRDIHTKFKDVKDLPDDLVQSKDFVGYINPLMLKLGMSPRSDTVGNRKKETKIVFPYKPKLCPSCKSPMQIVVRKKGDVELGILPKRGYTCNRGGTGCQDMKAKKYIRGQKVKSDLARTPNPKTKKVIGVRLEGSMIRA